MRTLLALAIPAILSTSCREPRPPAAAAHATRAPAPLPSAPRSKAGGCARLVEVHGIAAASARHVTIDASACGAGKSLSLALLAQGAPTAIVDLGETLPCATYGGSTSAAIGDPQGVVVQLGDLPQGVASYDVVVLVDLEKTDYVTLPEHLAKQEWEGAPAPPVTPSRRTGADTWMVVGGHVPGCAL